MSTDESTHESTHEDPETSRAALLDLPGVPESTLDARTAAALPASTPGAPWRCRVRAVVWFQRAGDGGAATLPEVLQRRPGAPLAVGAVVQYLDSPVGPYSEVLASPRVLLAPGLPRVHVPFIAVDSVPSVHGGRAHWGLPKARAEFLGDVHDAVRVVGDGWTVDVRARRRGPTLPVAVPFVLEQQPGRPARCGVGAGVRPAQVDVAVTGPTLPSWLGDGRHVGLLVSGRMVVGRRAAA